MKRYFYVIAVVLLLTLTGCGKNNADELENKLSKIQLTADLITTEAFYHNVAEIEKPAGSGLAHWFEKNRKLWIEYTGVVHIGVDLSKVKIEANGTRVKVFIPKAEIIGNPEIVEENFTEKSFLDSKDGFLNKNKITTEESVMAMNQAQEKMLEKVREDSKLLKKAQISAKNVIEEYINEFSGISDDLYTIQWEYE